MPNVPQIEGAGKYGGYYGDHLTVNQAEQVARSMSGGRIGRNAITFEGWKDHLPEYLNNKSVSKKLNLQTWEDRNRANKGTKLNP